MEYITAVTSRYIPQEDRIRLAVETQSKRCYELWLSQRMLRVMVPRLSRKIGLDDAAQHCQSAPAIASPASPSGPVVLEAGAVSWLINSVEFGDLSDRLAVVFCNPNQADEKLAWPMSSTIAQQWLRILHSQCQLAFWSSIDWPEWLLIPQPARVPEGVCIH